MQDLTLRNLLEIAEDLKFSNDEKGNLLVMNEKTRKLICTNHRCYACFEEIDRKTHEMRLVGFVFDSIERTKFLEGISVTLYQANYG